MKQNNITLVSNTVMNQNINSNPVVLNSVYGYSVQAVYTGTPTGTLKLQCSSDPVANANGIMTPPVNWNDIADSSYSVSSAGIYTWNVNGAFYNFMRLVYTDGSSGASTAVLNATVSVKGV
jgi:hypothetical protein